MRAAGLTTLELDRLLGAAELNHVEGEHRTESTVGVNVPGEGGDLVVHDPSIPFPL